MRTARVSPVKAEPARVETSALAALRPVGFIFNHACTTPALESAAVLRGVPWYVLDHEACERPRCEKWKSWLRMLPIGLVRRSLLRSLRPCARQLCTSSGSSSGASPWAVPFAVGEEKARSAFKEWSKSSSHVFQRLSPHFVPFYVFEAEELQGTFTGVLYYQRYLRKRKTREYYHHRHMKFTGSLKGRGNESLGALPGFSGRPAVYAGFGFRNKYLSRALFPCWA